MAIYILKSKFKITTYIISFFYWEPYLYIFFSYNICIRQEQGACCIKYSLCGDTYSYAIQNVAAIASGAYSGSYCSLDFLEITGLKKECGGSNQGVNRVCGHAYNVELGNTISASSLCGMYIAYCIIFIYKENSMQFS